MTKQKSKFTKEERSFIKRNSQLQLAGLIDGKTGQTIELKRAMRDEDEEAIEQLEGLEEY